MKKIFLSILILTCISINSYSQSGWFQLPSPTGNILNSMYFIDTLTGWSVGQNGTIIKTTNSGNSWFFQQSGVNVSLRSVVFTSPSLGWIAGDNGTILKSTNGGAIWLRKDITTNKNLRSVFFINSNTGWAVGDGGTILKYYYSGDNWLIQSSPVTSNLNSVFFSASTGWIAGDAGIILKTNSSGSWQINTNLGSLHNFTSICFPSTSTGYAAGVYQDSYGNKVVYSYFTPSGGDFWLYQLSGTTKIIRSITFTDENKGIAVGDSGVALITVNGGNNWFGQDSRTFNRLNSVYFSTSRNGWVVGDNGIILKTITSGYYDTLNTNRHDLGVIPIVLNSTLLLNAKYRIMFRAPDTSYNILRSMNNGASFDTIFSHVSLSDTGRSFDGLMLRVNKIILSELPPTGNDTGNLGVVQDPGPPANLVQTRLPGWDYFPPQNRYLEGSEYIIASMRPWQSISMTMSFPTKNTYIGVQSSLRPENLRKVKLVFTGIANGQMAYRYLASSGLNYIYQDMRPVPFKVYEIDETDSTPNPRQLNCAFLEFPASSGGHEDGMWDPTADSLGGKEILYIFNSNYDPAPSPNYTSKNLFLQQPSIDVMYVWSPKLIAPGMNFHVGDEFTIYPYTVTRPDIVPGYPLYYEFTTQTYIGIKKISTKVPKTYSLYQNYPNPFNPSTKIKFSLPFPSKGGVRLEVYDILGRQVASLIPPLWSTTRLVEGGQEGLQPGTYEVTWDASKYSSGVYFYKLTAGDYSETKKMVLIK